MAQKRRPRHLKREPKEQSSSLALDIRYPTTIVAEIGNIHEGSLGNAIFLAHAARQAGADLIKFQYHLAEFESTSQERFPQRFAYHPQDASRPDYWRRMEISPSGWKEIDRRGFAFAVSPFSVEAVTRLEAFALKNLTHYKIASGEVGNRALLDAIKATGKPVIISTGICTEDELDYATDLFCQDDRDHVTVLQCTTEYPTPADHVGMNWVQVYARNLCFRGGLSDHSGTIYPGIIATYLGARMVEVHVCWDKRQFGADATSSLTIDEFAQLCRGIRFAETMRRNPIDDKDRFNLGLPDVSAYLDGKKREPHDLFSS